MWSLGANNKLFLENPAFSPNIAKFDFTNTVIIMRKIGFDLPSPNISFIRPIFNYLYLYNIEKLIQTLFPGSLICMKMRYASPDFYEKL